jgi:hypothetical protein
MHHLQPLLYSTLDVCNIFCWGLVLHVVYFYGELLAPFQSPKLENHPFWLSVSTYSVYWQPVSISSVHPLFL